jgi:hypothetical protein
MLYLYIELTYCLRVLVYEGTFTSARGLELAK